MILTGYLIQVITQESWLKAMAISHIGLGLLFGLALLAHQFAAGGKAARGARTEERRVRRRRRRQRQRAQPHSE
jgi:hypothetical protein